MTAVASPPNFQSLPRLGWNSNNTGQGGLNPMSADDVSRMFMPRKSVQRTNSSSSIASSSSSTSTVSAPTQPLNGTPTANGESAAAWAAKKKPARGVWTSSKAEPVSGVSDARTQPVSSPASGPTASATMSAIHQPSPTVGSQRMVQSQQQNGVRNTTNGQNSNEPPAVLTLLPMNGTFERKQINVPFYPDILRIGRQTNAKTVPTPYNGYFDSKVLSRQHAEIWSERSGKILIRDVKSSNGTFVNGQRLSPENRDSEPHELREGDMLELGIDIVSEDQKTIVHHKVSAKVEHAGIYGTTTNVLDLNFGDLDPATGGGLLPSPLSQPMTHRGGRPGSAASMRSNGQMSGPQSVTGSHMNAMNQQRQMNFWMSPITIEQVVKKLTSEMKQAKEQTQDLNMTGEFLGSLLNQDPNKEQIKPSPTDSTGQRFANGKPKMPKTDSSLRFSDPPAPPPQQPLPEKPDGSRSARSSPASGSEPGSHPFLRRHDTERPLSASGNSPVNREPSSQILSLVEALNSAKKELDSQGARVKHLEDMLRQERSARESAEERARRLEGQPWRGQDEEVEAAFEPPVETATKDVHGPELPPNDPDSDSAKDWPSVNGAIDAPQNSDPIPQSLQQRLDKMVADMDEMKQHMEKYRRRAETAEDETATTRQSLAEMIEKIRNDKLAEAAAALAKVGTDADSETTLIESDRGLDTAASTASGTPSSRKVGLQNGNVGPVGQFNDLERAVATALASKSYDRNEMLLQSAPYASILGVVLIGVGLMTYLNSWQKLEK